MRIIALLCWYDEPAEVLKDCVEALVEVAGVDHLVAVDGAYALFPDGKRESSSPQASGLSGACRRMGLGHTFYTPERLWEGNEVEKRTFMHKLALTVSKPDDWHLVMDADQVVIEAPSDLRKRLRATSADVAEVAYCEGDGVGTVRCFFRAIPLFLERNHYTYVTTDGRILWSASSQPQEGVADLRDFKFEHRPTVNRTPRRLKRKAEYYAVRDEEDREKVTCERCLVAHAHLRLPTRWRLDDEFGYVADWAEVCSSCGNAVKKENRGAMAAMGLSPDMVTVLPRNGKAYAVPQDGRGLPDLFHQWLETRR